jgi:hypothetical protein
MKSNDGRNELYRNIKDALDQYESGIYVDKRTEVSKLMILGDQLKSDGPDRDLISIILSELLSEETNRGNRYWSGIDYLIEKLDLNKNKYKGVSVLNTRLESLIGSDKPEDIKSRYNLIRAFQHSGGKISRSVILGEEKLFKKTLASFWLSLYIDVYQSYPQKISRKIEEYFKNKLIKTGELIGLLPELYEIYGNDHVPETLESIIKSCNNPESKARLVKAYKRRWGELPPHEPKKEKESISQTRAFCKFLEQRQTMNEIPPSNNSYI